MDAPIMVELCSLHQDISDGSAHFASPARAGVVGRPALSMTVKVDRDDASKLAGKIGELFDVGDVLRMVSRS